MERLQKRNAKQISKLDSVAAKMLSVIDSNYNERTILNSKNARMQKIIDNELQLSKGVSNGNIIDFIASTTKNTDKNGTDMDMDTTELFTQDIGNLFGYFQEMYKNRYIQLSDLNFVSKFIPALGEAVKATLEGITNADDMSSSITRNLEFPSSMTDQEKSFATSEIMRIEKEYKLLKRLKNTVYKKALVSGTFYVYAVPYAELFQEYDRLVKTGKIHPNPLSNRNNNVAVNGRKGSNKLSGFNMNNNSAAKESDFAGIMESVVSIDSIMENVKGSSIFDKNDFNAIKNSVTEATLSNISMIDSDFMLEALEGINSIELMQQNLHGYTSRFDGVGVMKDFNVTTDGTASSNNNIKSVKGAKFNTTGTYIKYISPNHLLPIKVFNQIIGYFHINDTTVQKKDTSYQSSSETNLLAVTSNLFNASKLTEKKREAAVKTIVDTISNGILDKFSNRFVNKNAEFKDLIADCIIANGLVNNEFQIQFIPAKYIIPFVINEDENGYGESILQDSLFPAKLLLSLVVSKLLTYMNKSGNKSIAYVKKGPIDVNGNNQIQRVIRMLQEQQITFSDLLSTNLTFSKFSRNGNIQLPTARNGDRLVEFETQEGQQVDLKPEFEEWLEKQAIMGTGVPSVIMEYTDAADYAKSIVSGHIKFASRIASLQSDFEDPTTELYKVLIYNSNLPDDLKTKIVSSFKFTLPRPKVLSNANIADYLQTIQGVAQTEADIMFGTNYQDEDPNAGRIKDAYIRNTVIDNAPFIDWEQAEQRKKDAELNVIKDIKVKNDNPPEDAMTDIDGASDEELDY